MSVVKNFSQVDQSGRLGEQVFYVVNGETRARKLAAKVNNPRTVQQMEQRTKWANLVNFYRTNRGWMKYAFENKKRNQSDYNKFMSLNVTNSRIYLPKSFANQGACVVDAYTMTQGSLPSIETTKTSTGWATNLYLNDANAIPENPTIGEVTRQLLTANPALREGDQLSFIRLTQQTNPVTGVPYVVVRKYEVILNSSSVKFFYDYMPIDYIVFDGGTNPNCIEVNDSGYAGGFLMILSRTISGKTYVSSQNIVVANNSAMIDAYSSSNAQQAAIDSYGESVEPFLTSTTAEQDSQAAVRPSVVGVKINGVSYPPGSNGYPVNLTQNLTIVATFSQDLGSEGTVIAHNKLSVFYEGELEDLTADAVTIDGNTVTITKALAEAWQGVALASLDLEVGEDTYRAVWTVPNEATISGLE